MNTNLKLQEDLSLFQELATELLRFETEAPVAPMVGAEDLSAHIDLTLNRYPLSHEELRSILRDVLLYTPKTATHLFFNQLFGGRQGKAVVGELLSALLNNSMYTYKVAGPMVLIEKAVINKMKELIGYPSTSEGTIAAGGSMTNLMALLMARDHHAPKMRDTGERPQLMAYTSQEAHYSIAKNAAFAGIGKDNVRKIACDARGRMQPEQLDLAIASDISAGRTPFFVNATSGTTVLGAFDPLEEIAAICQHYGVWMHIDGAFGGSALFSSQYRYLMKGCELSDSISINAHKMLGVPLTCSLILSQHKKALYDSFSMDADYLYQTDTDEINPGKISLQCGRRNDALKFWTLWKSLGTTGLQEIVDHQFYLADVARRYVRSHPDYKMYQDGPGLNVCFNYKHIDPERLCNSLYEQSVLMVGYGSFGGDNFVRLVTVNANNDEADILTFFKKLEQFAATLL